MTTDLDLLGWTARWPSFVHAWAEAGEDARADLVDRALDEGIGWLPPYEGTPPAERVRSACEAAVLHASGIVDAFGYFWHNPDLPWYLCGHDEEVRHFAHVGWKELRNPHPGFDLWFYWCRYLDPTRDDVNPAIHYLLEGRRRGFETKPAITARPEPDALEAGRGPRRVCLFAGYDVDGLVDETVVAYLRDLSRFADIYYLADCPLEPGELDKLAPYTKGRWAIRHGRYDFGSYSMLAKELVGWDVIESYDELVLANDSCYLVQPFDRVFARMDAKTADWWGLQATYEKFNRHEYERAGGPLQLDHIEHLMRQLDLWRYSDFVHVGSYFLVYRSRVIQDPEFRRRLDLVAKQSDKTAIILKYEIGFSRYLILGGYHLATFVDGILPYHPVYRDTAFTVMRDGFPLLKRQFLYENPFSQPDLVRWKQRVLEAAPGADVEAMERNLLRVAPSFSLHRSFAVRTAADGHVELPAPIGPDEFADEEAWTPQHDHWWAFPVDPVSHRLEGNARAVFEAVAHDPSIRKLVLTASVEQKLAGDNVVTEPVESMPGQYYLLRSGTIFVTRGPRTDVNHPLSGRRHRFVGLRRGTPLAAFGAAVPFPDTEEGRERRLRARHDNDLTATVVTSSETDRAAMEAPYAAGQPVSWWVTGAPRTDFLLAGDDELPADLRRQAAFVGELLDGRRLVLWHPAARPGGEDDLPRLGDDDATLLVSWLADRGAVLGVRPPVTGPVTSDPPSRTPWRDRLVEAGALDLSAHRVPDVEVVLRATDVLVSDYTEELADFPVTGRPVVCFAPDLEEFSRAPGLLHDLADVVGGLPCRDVAQLRAAVAAALEKTDAAVGESGRPSAVLHTHADGRSATRVVREVKRTYLPIDDWLADSTAP